MAGELFVRALTVPERRQLQQVVHTGTPAKGATHLQHFTATRVLYLASDDNESQDADETMVVKGPRSQVLLPQQIGQLMASNDKASHRLVRGLLKSG